MVIGETEVETYGWPDSVVIRELVRESRRPSAKEFVYCDDLQTLKAAFSLSGREGLMWLLIAHRTRLKKTVWVTLPQAMLNEWGIDKSAKSRALAALQAAGYVEVNQSLGRTAHVRLVSKEVRTPA